MRCQARLATRHNILSLLASDWSSNEYFSYEGDADRIDLSQLCCVA